MAVVAIVVSAGIIWYVKQGVSSTFYQQPTTQNTQGTTTPPQPYASPKTLSYSDAVRIYKDHRIQFDQNCLPVPNYVVFKVGTRIMLDNRANKSRTISLDGVNYTLKPYGFTIVTLATTAKLPHTIKINCGTGKNNARIFLEQ